MVYILWHVLVLTFQEFVLYYLKMHHFSRDSAHILCSVKTLLIVLVFCPTCNKQSKNQNNVFSIAPSVLSWGPCTEWKFLKTEETNCFQIWSTEMMMMMIWSYVIWLCLVVHRYWNVIPEELITAMETSHLTPDKDIPLAIKVLCIHIILATTPFWQWPGL
jgi:hypothetical protein